MHRFAQIAFVVYFLSGKRRRCSLVMLRWFLYATPGTVE
jgi:hypothetical protein